MFFHTIFPNDQAIDYSYNHFKESIYSCALKQIFEMSMTVFYTQTVTIKRKHLYDLKSNILTLEEKGR